MVLPSECLSTDITWIRTFICVGSLMNQEVVGFGKLATTETANVLLLCPEIQLKMILLVDLASQQTLDYNVFSAENNNI